MWNSKAWGEAYRYDELNLMEELRFIIRAGLQVFTQWSQKLDEKLKT